MAIITATFPSLTFGKRGVQTREVFVQTQEAGQDVLSGPWATAAALFKTEANDVRNEVNTLKNDTEGFKNTSIEQANLATQQVVLAQQEVSKATAQVVIATEKATAASVSANYAEQMRDETAGLIELLPADVSLAYNKAAIDTMMNRRDLENFINFKF